MAHSYDLAVVGAGPAGLAAACVAAEAGQRVALIDEAPHLGGQIWRHRRSAAPPSAARLWLRRLEKLRSSDGSTAANSGVELFQGASVFDADSERLRLYLAGTDETLDLEAPRRVLATGARELFWPFPGWTLPGVVGVGGLQALLKSGGSVRDRRVVIAGSGPLLLPVAASAARAGAGLALVAEQASASAVSRFGLGLWRRPSKILQGASYRLAFAKTPYRFGTWVCEAFGESRVEEVLLSDGRRVPCDVLAAGYGLVPNTELARLLGCRLEDGFVVVDEHQQSTVEQVFCAGELTSIGGVDAALIEGEIAGLSAAGRPVPAALRQSRDEWRSFAAGLAETFAPRKELFDLPREETLICRCEDVAWGSLRELRESRQAKLATRIGMGPCQGRVCGPICHLLRGWEADSVRPPLRPVPVSAALSPSREPGMLSG